MLHFIESFPLTGGGRCGVCDFIYSPHDAREVADHRAHHREYRHAVDAGWAPVHERERERLVQAGLRAQQEGRTLAERVAGAEQWLLAQHHAHLARVLLHGVGRQDLRTFFTRMEAQGLAGRFEPGVAAVMRDRYSDCR